MELDLADLVDAYRKKHGLLFWYGILHGLHHMKEIIKTEKIDCDYEENPTLYGEVRHHWKNHAASYWDSSKEFSAAKVYILLNLL